MLILEPDLGRPREATGTEALTAVSDHGYYRGEEILACEQAGITTHLAKPQTSGNQAKGLFGKRDFRYLPEEDACRCPAVERLIWRYRSVEDGKTLDTDWSSACPGCAMHTQCTTGEQRRVRRWEHEAVLEAVQARLDAEPETMRLRRQTRGASVRDHQGMDGLNPLPHQDPAEGAHRDEPARARLQPQASHQHPRNQTAAEGNEGLRQAFFAPNRPLQRFPGLPSSSLSGSRASAMPDRRVLSLAGDLVMPASGFVAAYSKDSKKDSTERQNSP